VDYTLWTAEYRPVPLWKGKKGLFSQKSLYEVIFTGLHWASARGKERIGTKKRRPAVKEGKKE